MNGNIEDRPVLDKEEDAWVLKVRRTCDVRIPLDQRALATAVWESATWAYHNGCDSTRKQILQALGLDP